MARRRAHSPTAIPFAIASPSRLVGSFTPYRARPRAVPSALSLLEDRRRFHPDGRFSRPAAVPRSAARVVVRRATRFKFPDVFRFRVPERVVMCVRRKERREVLFAKNRTRSGGAKARNYWSSVSCKR